MLVLITYDVNTENAAGRKRLRQVAKQCVNYGQRVQNSVFECQLDSSKLREVEAILENIIDKNQDSLRFYIIGNGYVARGYCAEAKCSFLADENPVTDILSGKIKFHLYLAPYTPAESIEAILEFNPSAITESIFGGEQ